MWAGGRHTTGTGFHNDTVKYNTALLQGWRVLRFTSKSVRDGSAIEMVQEAMKGALDGEG